MCFRTVSLFCVRCYRTLLFFLIRIGPLPVHCAYAFFLLRRAIGETGSGHWAPPLCNSDGGFMLHAAQTCVHV